VKFVRAHINFEKSSRSVKLWVPENTPRYLAWAKRAIRIGLVLFLLQAGIYYAHEYLTGAAMEQRRILFQEFTKLNSRLDQFDAKIANSFQDEDLLHLKFGLKSPDQDTREMGTGGSVDADSAMVWAMNPSRALSAEITERNGQLRAKIERSQNSYTALKGYIEQQYLHWQRIPTVAPASGRYSSPFGIRTHPVTGEVGKMHFGIDISNSRWTPIYATASGRVSLVKYSDYFGNYVVVDHGNGFETKYGHMEKPIVKEGQLVNRYQVLGYMGRTGRTTGIHIHYEVWQHNDAVNPVYYILPHDYAVE
jgi:murein DD-endopeptidase MepM/ murein hydrolase activator NlpD